MPRWTIETPPFAIALLTGILRQHGFTVFPRDYDVEFYRAVDDADRWAWTGGENPVDWGNPVVFQEMCKRYDHLFEACVEDVLEDEPDVVGFSVKVWSLEFSRELARRIKARRPDVYVIFGGPEMNKGPEHHLDDHPEVDAICRQEADVSFPAFLKTYVENGRVPGDEPGFAYRDEGGATVDCGLIQRPPGVDDFPFADDSDFDFEKYTEPSLVNLVLSRGCIFRCTFCSEAPAFMKFRSYDADRIISEVDHVRATTNIREPIRVHFNDSLLNGDPKALEGLADRILERGDRPFEWGGMMAPRKQMTDEMVDKIARAGCGWTFVGMESGSQAVIRLMKKAHDLDTAKRLTSAMHEAGMKVTVSIVTGYPGEGEREFYETVDALLQIAPNVDHVMLHTLSLSTGSILTNAPERFGVDVSTVSGNECWDRVGDEGKNTVEIRMHRLFTLQHMFRGKIVDYGGPMGRDDHYDPFRELEQEHESRVASLRAGLRHVRVDAVDDTTGYELGALERSARLDPDAPAGEGRVGLVGWARDARTDGPADGVVLLGEGGRVLAHAFVDRRRVDVARHLGRATREDYGFELVVPEAALAGDPAALRVCAYDSAANLAHHLGGAAGLAELLVGVPAGA